MRLKEVLIDSEHSLVRVYVFKGRVLKRPLILYPFEVRMRKRKNKGGK